MASKQKGQSKLMARNTQGDQHNPNMKVKYLTDDDSRIPLHRHICDFKQSDTMYNADGSKSKRSNTSKEERTRIQESEFTKNAKPLVIDDDEFDDDFNKQFFGDTVSRGTSSTDKCCNKSRYIHAPYEPTPNFSHGGYGTDLDRFAQNKYGVNTRDKHESLSDVEIDRFHFTYRDYQKGDWGTFPLPENTRLTNKKTLNN